MDFNYNCQLRSGAFFIIKLRFEIFKIHRSEIWDQQHWPPPPRFYTGRQPLSRINWYNKVPYRRRLFAILASEGGFQFWFNFTLWKPILTHTHAINIMLLWFGICINAADRYVVSSFVNSMTYDNLWSQWATVNTRKQLANAWRKKAFRG